MADRFTPPRGGQPGNGWPSSGHPDDDPWGPSTAAYSRGARPNNNRFDRAPASAPPPQAVQRTRPPVADDGWTPAGPVSKDKQRANRLMERQLRDMRTSQPAERGVRWWLALVVLIVIAGIGGLIDTIGTTAARGGFNIGIVVASIVAILIVKRSHMFPIVIAPPIVYSLAAVFQLYLRSSGLHDKKVVLDAAANYLVYGFPAIAAATAGVLIIAGIRLIVRK